MVTPSLPPPTLARVRQIRRRLNTGVWLGGLRGPLWVAALVAALARLLLRSTPAAGVAFLATLAPALTLMMLRSRTRLYSLEAACALADRQAGAGGLLLTQLERPVDAWAPTLEPR